MGGAEGGIAVVEQGQLLRLGVPHLAPGAVLPVTHVDLPQAGVQVEGEVFGQIDGPGGELGADQVAGVDRLDGDSGKALLQGLDLTHAVGGDQGVIPAVDAAVQIASASA